MTGFSSAPAAIAALVANFQVIDLDGEVRDGPQVGDAEAREVISVGYIGPDDDASAEATLASGGLGGPMAGLMENYQLHCAVAVSSGNEDVPAARVRAFAIFAECGERLAADGDLHKTVMNTGLSNWQLREDMTTGGVVVRIRFDVSVQAWAGR
jgi:hypothetical protein